MSSLFVKKVAFQCVSGACRVDVFRCLSTTRPPMKWSGEKSAGRSEKKNRSPNAENSSEEVVAKNANENIVSRLQSLARNETTMKPQQALEIKDLPPSMRSKFRLFQDETEEVLDSAQAEWVVVEAPDEVDVNEFEGLSLERGKTGVYDIHELVEVLQMENADDICVVSIPPENKFAEYMVIASGRSPRQLIGMGQFISRYYKAKKHEVDPFLENNSVSKWKPNWVCLDLGNIILHLMDPATRSAYDIEALWALGPEHDPLYQTPMNAAVELVERHSRIVTQDKLSEKPQAVDIPDPDQHLASQSTRSRRSEP